MSLKSNAQFDSMIDEANAEIGRLTGLVDGFAEDAKLMRELKAAVRGMNGLSINYQGPKQILPRGLGLGTGRGLVTEEELRRIDRILNRIETEANQGV